MAISQETRKRVVLIVVALIVVALVLTSTGCSTVSGTDQPGQAGQDRDGPPPLGAGFYPAAVTEICATTDEQLARLPAPGAGMAEADWANEVSMALEAEAAALGEVGTISDVRDDHRAFIDNTSDQATQWSLLSAAVTDADADGIDSARTEILELSRGRIELATELGISGCRERSFG